MHLEYTYIYFVTVTKRFGKFTDKDSNLSRNEFQDLFLIIRQSFQPWIHLFSLFKYLLSYLQTNINIIYGSEMFWFDLIALYYKICCSYTKNVH